MGSIIGIKKIYKSFGSNAVIRGISAEINKGEIVAIIGPSGSGKSTLLRCINGLEIVDDGEIVVDNIKVKNAKSVAGKIGMVFQSFNLFPHYTVLDNITNPCRIVLNMPENKARKHAMELLEKVRLKDKAGEYPGRLSGGQQQRVAIARALSMNPEIMLFDEPTSSLDPELAYEVFDTMKSIVRDDLTIILVTHQISMVKNFANRVLFLEDGKIIFDGDIADLMQSNNHRISQFLDKILL